MARRAPGQGSTRPRDLAGAIGEVLDELLRRRSRRTGLPGEAVLTRAGQRLRRLERRPGVLEALDRAVAERPARAAVAALALEDLVGAEGAGERLRAELARRDPRARGQLVAALAARRDPRFLPLLDAVALDPAERPATRNDALRGIGALPPEVACTSRAVEALVPQELDPLVVPGLTWACRRLALPGTRPFLRRTFAALPPSSDLRLAAAWGLAKLGEADALALLGEQVEAHSYRAAQALSDVLGWPEGFGQTHCRATRRRWLQRRESS